MSQNIYPADFLENAPPRLKGGHCFLVMPFEAPFSAAVYSALRSMLETLAITCHRGDQRVYGSSVMSDVLWGLAVAELLIVDVTGNNPNVIYELGIAHAIRCNKSVLLITQNIDEVAFDLRHLRIVKYTMGHDGLQTLCSELASIITTEILPMRFVYKLSENRDGKTSKKFEGEGRRFYSFRICDVMPALDAAEFRLVVWRHGSGLPDEVVYDERQPMLKKEETISIPKLPSWAIKLHSASEDEAEFCACRMATDEWRASSASA